MLFDNSETTRAIDAIKRGARGWTKDELESVLTPARLRKPQTLDAASRGAQIRYRGNQRSIIEQSLARRFPNTEDMPIAGINLLKLIARLDAGVYVVPSDRWLDDGKARIASDEPRGELWRWALERGRFHASMAEMERRALITPGVSVGHMVWVRPPGDKVGYPRIDLYWPHDVEVLCHWQAPTTIDFAYVVALRQSAPTSSSSGSWWRIYSREPPDDIGSEWGPWFSVLVSDQGEEASAASTPVRYEGKLLPIFMMQLSDPEGSVFVCQDTDLLDVVDDVNDRRSNESFIIGLQGHDQMWTNSMTDVKTKKGGPDTIMQVESDATIGVLSFNPALSDIRESRKLALRELAISRGNSPDAYATEPGPPLSGVAKRIANQTHDTRVAEQAIIVQHFEVNGPLPILKDVIETFHPDGKLLVGTRARMLPRKLPTFEDPAQRSQRLADAASRGWITEARAAADAEHYGSVDEAEKAMAVEPVSDAPVVVEEVATAPRPGPSPSAGASAGASADAAPGGETIQDTALNGAQGATFNAIVDKVVMKQWPKATATAAIRALFPAIPASVIADALDPLDTFEAPAPQTPAPPFGAPPVKKEEAEGEEESEAGNQPDE